jgi:hypothetical protein
MNLKPKRISVNLRMHPTLKEALLTYCKKSKRAGLPSDAVELLVFRHLMSKNRRYRLGLEGFATQYDNRRRL